MRTIIVDPNRPNPHLPHNSVEMQSPPPADAYDNEVAARNAELLISQMMVGGAAKQAPQPSAALKQATVAARTAPQPRGVTRRNAELNQTRSEEQDEMLRVARAIRDATPPQEAEEKGINLHISAVHVAAFLVGALAVFWPALALALLLLVCWLTIAVYLLLSSEKLAPVLHRIWRRFAKRRPATAEKLRRTADAAALKYDVMLDVLPESWAEALSLPDMSQPVRARGASRKPKTKTHLH